MSGKNDKLELSIGRRLARRFREEILSVPDGTFLGSEEDLIAHLGVSRPTFRQAARLLEHERILIVKRGVKGGYFTQRPQIAAVTTAAALYLRTKNTSLRQLLVAAHGLDLEAVRLACASKDEEKKRPLRDLLRRLRLERETARAPTHASEAAFLDAILILTDNPAIELFLKSIYHFGLYETHERLYLDRKDRAAQIFDTLIRLGETVLDGDTEIAGLLVDRRYQLYIDWLEGMPDREIVLNFARS